jgi:hypothetical protein
MEISMMKSMNTKLCMRWVAGAVMVTLALAAGCAGDAPVAPEEPATSNAVAVTVPASVETTARLGIATWRYMPTSDGIVVRGVAPNATSDAVAHVRFWISAGATPDELIAHGTDTGAQVSILREGGVRGDDAGLRETAIAFRVDVEASEMARKKGTSQNVNDHVQFCPGAVGTFGTWSFWAVTHVQIDNPSSNVWIKFSFRAGAGYEENWVPPASSATYGRQWAAFPVTISYIDWNPHEAQGPCPVNVAVY